MFVTKQQSLTTNEPIEIQNEPIESRLNNKLNRIELMFIDISKILMPALLSTTSLISFILGFIIQNQSMCTSLIESNYTNATTIFSEMYSYDASLSTVQMICNLSSGDTTNDYIRTVSDIVNMIFSMLSFLFVFYIVKQQKISKDNEEQLIKSSDELRNQCDTLSCQLETLSNQHITVENSPSNNVYHPYNMDSARESVLTSSTVVYPSPLNIV